VEFPEYCTTEAGKIRLPLNLKLHTRSKKRNHFSLSYTNFCSTAFESQIGYHTYSVTTDCCVTEQKISRPCNKQNANYNTQDTHRTSAIHVHNIDTKERGLVTGQ